MRTHPQRLGDLLLDPRRCLAVPDRSADRVAVHPDVAAQRAQRPEPLADGGPDILRVPVGTVLWQGGEGHRQVRRLRRNAGWPETEQTVNPKSTQLNTEQIGSDT